MVIPSLTHALLISQRGYYCFSILSSEIPALNLEVIQSADVHENQYMINPQQVYARV